MTISENQIEQDLNAKLIDLKYILVPTFGTELRGKRISEKFEDFNRVHLTGSEF